MSKIIMSDMKLPLTADEITTDWLNAALRYRYPEVVVSASKVEDIILGTSTKIRVSLQYAKGRDCGLPPTLIVKGGFEAHSPNMKDMYINEIRSYRDVLPFISMNTPACYYAGSDHDTHQSIVIMEDLRAKGVNFLHAQKPQTYPQVARRLTAMARYHAETWNTPELKPGGRWEHISGRHEGWSVVYQDRYLIPEVWQHYVDSPRGAAVSSTLHDRAWMAGALKKLGALHQQHPYCLVHGDTHLGNLYEERDGTPGFFDMQHSRGPWFMEVTYHLICALDMVDRPKYEQALLVHYLEALKANGIDAPGFEEAFECYRREIAYGFFIFLINEVKFQTEAINTAYAARFGAAAMQHDTVRLLS
jgi:hypothetical protein